MGASISAKQDGKTEEDATTKEQNAEVNEIPEGEDVDAKLLQKNGQISSLNGGADDQTAELNGHTEENVLAEVGQTDSVSVSQKEDGPETMETLQEEVAPQVNGEKEEKELPSADAVTSTEEEKSAEDSSGEANEVGFKKIFRFVGFKFTLKKDKNEKAEPVQLLTVKKEEGGEASGSEVAEDSKEEAATAEPQPVEEEKAAEESEPTEPAAEPAAEETPTEKVNGDATEQAQKEEEPTKEASPEKEAEPVAESSTVQETQSPLRRFFTGGIFSNLRKRTSFKKPKEEEAPKEKAEDDIKETEETIESPAEEEVETSKEEAAPEPPQEESATPQEGEAEPTAEAVAPVTEEQKEDEVKVEDIPQEISEEATEAEPVEVTEAAQPTEDAKPEEEKVEEAAEGQTIPEEVPVTTAEPELLSSQEKAKVQGSPLKKLFTGSGLKKISSKKQKGKKEAEAKLTESGEQVAEQLLSSTESAEDQKEESSASSPEESGEHVVGKTTPAEASQETEGEATTSDGERKKDGILPWASFKKLVTPKKRVKRPSESEDEGAEKPKSATLSSTESAVFVEKPEEAKPSEEEPKVTLEQSTEEPKKKMDTSVSWEALICVGSAKKRARKTSDSDDEAPKIEEEVLQSGEEQVKPAESPLGSSQEADQEHLTSSPEPAGSPSEGEGVSTWESLKRFVTPRRKAKAEDKTDESTGVTEPVSSDSEIPKEESTFSLKKLIPGRRKKKGDGKQEQVSSDEAGKDVGSAEEDSDTPAVVPLSEYDAAEPEPVDIAPKEEVVSEKAAETTEAEETKPEAEPDVAKPSDVVPATAADERSPSWISPTAVEDIQETTECLTKHQQLSDIPEEGDTVATLKSTTEDVSRDDTIAEDIVEFTSEAVTAVEQVPETSVAEETTEMVSAVSRMTESAGTSGETTPVPGEAEEKKTVAVLQEAVSLIPNELSMTMTNEQPEAIPVTVLPQVVEVATKMETPVLVSHQQSEATSICTGLESQEIESVEEETLKVSIESITEVSEVMTTELALEDKTEKTEEANVTEDKVYEAESQEVKMEIQETQPSAEPEAEDAKEVEAVEEAVTELQEQLPLENALDEAVEMGQVKEEQEVAELANELSEVQPVSVAVVNAVQGKAEHVEAVVFTENTPKTEAEGPAEITVEESVFAQTLQVTEVPTLEAEKVQELDDVKQSSADAELAPVEEVVEVTKQEVTASMPEPAADETSGIEETPIPVVAPAEEFPVVKETKQPLRQKLK
ncbi:hypothetical protein AGOR_G00085290 [Albula goreensis]|uniref:A kinase-anchoring proteins AKAP-5 and AKAP-12 calmodulin (CaM)-binding domain-containing protein n=1 Tax=Albula goreensis TaxID=1534307 RepID=A0A8T3DP73_9TELE|nr:hypothetical protein AGOR_G00085290 [Albula goreensis]